jgi:hypothetical protein
MKTDIQIFEYVAYSSHTSNRYKLNALASSGGIMGEIKATPTAPIRTNPFKAANIMASWGSDNLRP